MLLLELFCGTKSIGRAFQAEGWEVFSLDLDPSCDATWTGDVREFDPAVLPRRPNLIWASPCCTHYSRARTKAKTPRDLEWADSLVQAALRIQAACGCPMLLENPHSGLLKTRDVLRGIPYATVDYCMYSDERCAHAARKRTAIWMVGCTFRPARPLCSKDCGHCVGNRHAERAQQGSAPGCPTRRSLAQLHAIPPLLCEEIAAWADEVYARPHRDHGPGEGSA